jgi:peptidoglycan/xylan/chitin deacetylase (PgdA/CDA1 family)
MHTEPPPRLILATHDLAPVCTNPDPAARDYWMPFRSFRALFAELAAEADGYEIELTSDDAFVSDYDELLPWLVETGQRATFFIPAAFVGRPGRLTVAQLLEMQALGMRIGCHGVDHLRWTDVSDVALANEIAGGKRRLEDWLGTEVMAVAPPYGAYDARVHQRLCAVGFSEIYTARGGYSLPAGRLRPRFMVQSRTAAELLALGQRGPGFVDGLKSRLHELQARFN